MTGRQNGLVGREGQGGAACVRAARHGSRGEAPRASAGTVDFHVGPVYWKLSVSSRSQPTRFIVQTPAANA